MKKKIIGVKRYESMPGDKAIAILVTVDMANGCDPEQIILSIAMDDTDHEASRLVADAIMKSLV